MSSQSVAFPIEKPRSSLKPFLVMLASGIVPGIGQLLEQRWLSGTIFLSLAIAIDLVSTVLRTWTTPDGLDLTSSALILLSFLSALHAGWRRNVSSKAGLLVVPFAVIVAFAPVYVVGRLLWRPTGFRLFSVPSRAMEPTIQQNDRIVADFSYYRSRPLKDGDPVVIWVGGTFFLKRVAALPGQTIEGRNATIYVNGIPQHDPYVEHTSDSAAPELDNFGPILVAPEECFLLGDNRDISLDSRTSTFGPKDLSVIVGRPLYVLNNASTKGRSGVSIN